MICVLATVIELATTDEMTKVLLVFFQPVKEVVLTVNVEMVSCQTQGYDIKVREARDNTTTRNISKVINQSVGEFLAYLKYFDEICL